MPSDNAFWMILDRCAAESSAQVMGRLLMVFPGLSMRNLDISFDFSGGHRVIRISSSSSAYVSNHWLFSLLRMLMENPSWRCFLGMDPMDVCSFCLSSGRENCSFSRFQ